MRPDFFFGQPPFLWFLPLDISEPFHIEKLSGFEMPLTPLEFNFKYPLFHIFNVKEAKLNEHE